MPTRMPDPDQIPSALWKQLNITKANQKVLFAQPKNVDGWERAIEQQIGNSIGPG